MSNGPAIFHPGSVLLRPAVPGDEVALFELVQALASYERLEHAVTGSAEALGRHLFGERPIVEALLAEADGKAIGYALFFATYSTFLTAPGLYWKTCSCWRATAAWVLDARS